MAKEYSWEQASSYLPPQREGFGWPILIAVVVALVIHLMLLIYFGSHFIKLPVAEPQEWVSKPVNMSEIQTELEAGRRGTGSRRLSRSRRSMGS